MGHDELVKAVARYMNAEEESAQLRALNEQYLGQIREQAKTIEAQRAECMDLRVAVEIRERNIGEMTFQLRAANLQNEEYLNALYRIAAIPPTGDGHLMRAQNIADEAVAKKPVDEKQKYCDHGWDRTGDDAVCKYCKIAARDVLKPKDEGCCHHPGPDPVYCWCPCHPAKGIQPTIEKTKYDDRQHLLDRCYHELYASMHDEREHKREDCLMAARAIAERIAAIDNGAEDSSK